MSQPLHIVLGSLSPIKTKCVKDVFSKIFGEDGCTFTFIAAKSDINEQPYTFEETSLGAYNRIKNTLSDPQLAKSHVDFAVAIENGIVPLQVQEKSGQLEEIYIDMAWVIVRDLKANRDYCATSTGIPFAKSYLEKAKAKGLSRTTVADIMNKEDSSINKKDPHASMTGDLVPRAAMLDQALLTCLGQYKHDHP